MATITFGGRQHGKSWAAATSLGLSMDEYREMVRRQREQLAAARALIPIPPPRDFFRELWDEASRSHYGQDAFMREYLAEFAPPAPDPMGPPAPTFAVWQRNQDRNAREERRARPWDFARHPFRFDWTDL